MRTLEQIKKLHDEVSKILEGSGLQAIIYDPKSEYMKVLFTLAGYLIQLEKVIKCPQEVENPEQRIK